jgi:large subunit ribosomal protein L17
MPAPPKGRRFGGSASPPAADDGQPGGVARRRRGHRHHRGQGQGAAPGAEKLITKAKKGGLHNHRQVVAYLGDKEMAHKLFDEIGPRYADATGGLHPHPEARPRQGDNAPMARIELV